MPVAAISPASLNCAITEIGAGQRKVTVLLKLDGQKLHQPKESPPLTLGRRLKLDHPLQVVERGAKGDLARPLEIRTRKED